MKIKILISILCVVSIFSLWSKSDAYLLWFKSRDNTITNIQQIEEEYAMRLPIVSFIFDPYTDVVETLLNKLPSTLWTDRIYHISLSPNSYTAKQVVDGEFDVQYNKFFALIKSGDLRVIFRTMHEMNGGRYPRASDPTNFKKARIHVRNLSRAAGLTSSNILFDMSLNAWDLPAKGGKPSQTATFLSCTLAAKASLHCPTFEDYYPWTKYVDILGVTFYNRWKWNSNRRWGTPEDIVNAKWRNTLDRMKTFNKPIFVDEVGTTAVNYAWAYNYKTSLAVYNANSALKNTWLLQLRDFLDAEPTILGANYFNVDLTNGLKNRTLGELDWSVIDFQSNKFYTWIMAIYNSSEKLENNSSVLFNLFGIKYLTMTGVKQLVPSAYIKPVRDLYQYISSGNVSASIKLQTLATVKSQWNITRLYRKLTATQATEILNILEKIFKAEKKGV